MIPPLGVSNNLGLEKIESLKEEYLGHPLWQYVAFIGWLCVAFFVGWLVASWLDRRLRKQQERNAAPWLIEVTRVGRRPLALLAFLWVLNHAVRVFEWSPDVAAMLGNVCTMVAAVALTIAGMGAVELVADHLRRRLTPLDQVSYVPVIALVTNVLRVFIIVIAVIVTAQNMGIEVSGLLTTLGIGGIATALAAQETLANLFGCVVLFADRAFAVGDKIKMETVEGTVDRIGLRSTRLHLADGTMVTIPNKTLAGAVIYNLSRKQGQKAQTV